MSNSRKKRGISKTALGDQHGLFQHFQTNTTDYATRDRYLALRGGDASLGRDTESLYGVFPEGDDSRVPTEYVAPHLSTRYSPDRVGVQAMRVSDGVYQDPYTNKVYDYNEGFKTEDGRNFPGGSASLQSSLMRVANTLDIIGFVKEASRLDDVIKKVSNATGGSATGGSATISGGNQTLNQTFNLNDLAPSSGVPEEPTPEPDLEEGEAEFEFKPVENPCVDSDVHDIFKALFEAHEDPESTYKLSPDRIPNINPCTLTPDEKRIVAEASLPEGWHIKGASLLSRGEVLNVLAAAANQLENIGLEEEAETTDSVAANISEEQSSAESEAQALDDIVSLASRLDEKGQYEVADIIDSWIKRQNQ